MTLAQAKKEVDDGLTVRLVEVAGRFIRQQNARPRGRGAGKGDPLLLSPRHLGRVVIGPVAKAHGLKFRRRPVKGILVTGQFQRRRHVFQGSHCRDEVEGLEHHPHIVSAKAGQMVFVHRGQVLPKGGDLA